MGGAVGALVVGLTRQCSMAAWREGARRRSSDDYTTANASQNFSILAGESCASTIFSESVTLWNMQILRNGAGAAVQSP